MKTPGMSAVVTLLLLFVASSNPSRADETQRRITTVVAGGTLADGQSQISKEVIEECIVSLPNASDLEPIVDVQSKYMTSIGGDDTKNGSVRTYHATVTIPYLIKQKQLVIVTTSSVEKSEPVVQEVSGRFDRSIEFSSNPQNGDRFAGRELVHEYYFSSEQKAIDDAMRRAKAWLKQKRTVLCKD